MKTECKEVNENMEKYLKIQLAGHLPVTAFPSKEKLSEKHPDFVGQGVSVWVNTPKQEQQAPAVETVPVADVEEQPLAAP